MNICLTGGTGFLGSRLVSQLSVCSSDSVELLVRRTVPDSIINFQVKPDFSFDLSNQNVVIHAAARAHVLKDDTLDSVAEFRRVNVEGTVQLARQAVRSGVDRFIFVSSIGVNGNQSLAPFTALDSCAPIEPYAQSKWEAEQALWEIHRETGLEITIIRPPLVYGPGAPGNFGKLLKWAKSGVPLPLGSVNNSRSLVAVDNLVDLIITCIDHPAAANQTFLVCDGQDLSTTELLRGLGQACGRPARLIPLPATWLRFGASLLGKREVANRLLGNLQVDITHTCQTLDWTPPISVDEGLRRCFSD